MENCIFCKIVLGQIPSYKVYEDDEIIAFLDISQATKGHTLVVPKNHSSDLLHIDSTTLSKAIIIAQKIASSMMLSLDGIKGINIINNCGVEAGQSIMHFHIHVIPRYSSDDFVMHGSNPGNVNDLLKISEIIKRNI